MNWRIYGSTWSVWHQGTTYLKVGGGEGWPLHIASVPWMASLHLLIWYHLTETSAPTLLCPPVHYIWIDKGAEHMLSDPASWLSALRTGLWECTRYFKSGSETESPGLQGDEALDLGLISSILLPTELTTDITLESTAHYRLCAGTSVFTWFESSSQSKSVFSIDELLQTRTTNIPTYESNQAKEKGGRICDKVRPHASNHIWK